ncbi:tetratricopeptide repeat protein [Francisellaceae bacterium]|nr:tetratricopeptide repeat protein [Francisellaceae bacterium]
MLYIANKVMQGCDVAYIDVEQSQIENIKKLWNKFGNYLLTLLLVLAVAYAGWTYYSRHQKEQVYAASALYSNMLEQQAGPEQTIATGNAIMKAYPSTIYASFAALILAQQYVKQDNLPAAETSLKWVIDHSENAMVIVIAEQRLARIYISKNDPKQALALLDGITNASGFEPFVAYVKGDAYAKMGNNLLAEKFWKQAIQTMNKPEDEPMKQYLAVKISSLSATKPLSNQAKPVESSNSKEQSSNKQSS